MTRKQRVMLDVRIKIMEDVERRVNDPALDYHRKRETVEELKGYLRRIRKIGHKLAPKQTVEEMSSDFAYTAPNYVSEEVVQGAQPVRRRKAQIEQTLARIREAKVVAVLRGVREGLATLLDSGVDTELSRDVQDRLRRHAPFLPVQETT